MLPIRAGSGRLAGVCRILPRNPERKPSDFVQILQLSYAGRRTLCYQSAPAFGRLAGFTAFFHAVGSYQSLGYVQILQLC